MTIQTNNAQNIGQITSCITKKPNLTGKIKSKLLTTRIKSNTNINNNINFIYVTDSNNASNIKENPLNTKHSELYCTEDISDLNSTFPLFFQNIDKIYIPKKSKRHLEKCIPIEYLRAIDNNTDIAIEKCLILLSNLSSTIYSENKWKELSSRIMDLQTKKGKDNTIIYSKIIKALKYCTNTTDALIQIKTNGLGNETYQEGIVCKSYSLTNTYYNSGLVEYSIKDKDILQKRNEFFYSQLNKAQTNIIANNLIGLYSKIELPTLDDLKIEAKKLVKAKHKTKKGKILTFLNKHNKSYFKDASSRSFVEENIKLFEFLTKRSFLIPIIGDEKSGGRVVDSFTLMPSWIRNQLKIDDEPIVEVDYKALHPNIAMTIYGGSKKYITHEIVANETNYKKEDVKIEHLSFFNKTQRDMRSSILYKYYESSEPQMLNAIVQDKWSSNKKHKITSMKFFAKEVEIMTECIRLLNAEGINVGYVYDALFCKKSDAEKVKSIMDKVVLQCNVYTTAQINY
ncbi:hypothetical protein [Flavobacterium nitratireducens]|uniref:hypothetical protein n=1 Tax=Flavobacterium nitratireducens TaxID=992289 RepID=UPI00241520DD|nr:hypothetical protein [Flavobacterium nitratireducens]